MRRKFENSGREPNRLLAHLTAEKKKTVAAICLLTVMALMWARVLGRKTARAVELPVTQTHAQSQAAASSTNTRSFIDLPKIKGRHDTLTGDFFAANGWRYFRNNSEGQGSQIKEVNVVTKDGSEEVVKRIAGKLNLLAILSAENPQAFINNKLLSVGDKLVIKEGVDSFECEVIDIQENKVSVRFKDARIILKLARAGEVSE